MAELPRHSYSNDRTEPPLSVSHSQDLTIPLSLLQATGNIGSVRDREGSLSWQPQAILPDGDNYTADLVSRRGTHASHHNEPAGRVLNPIDESRSYADQYDDLSPGSQLQARVRPLQSPKVSQRSGHSPHRRPSHFSYSSPRSYIASRGNDSTANGASARSTTSTVWSTANPFGTSNDQVGTDAIDYARMPALRNISTTSRPQAHGSRNAGRSSASQPRRVTLQSDAKSVVSNILHRRDTYMSHIRRGSLWQVYEKAKVRGVQLQRNRFAQTAFEYAIYTVLLSIVYFVLIGVPLWKGTVYWMWWVVANKFVIAGGFSITLGIALFYAFAPLLILFEKDPPVATYFTDTKLQPSVQDTALMIPCYKSAGLIAATLQAALKIFPPSHIFVIANGNSPTPLDNTEEVCRPFGVNHIWSPVGSKIVAQFVGCYAAKQFKNVLLIDDDCALPENFPIVTDRLKGNVQCIGYTIKSVGPNSTKGNLCQQAQDLEYKLSGIQRAFAGRFGSATFPHGAISLWDRQLLVKTFHEHPGFSVSEDWFFGDVARRLGCRITMCSQVFVETETPTAVFFSSGGSRGGFGEMTIFQQRFKRWNFFFVNGMYYNLSYIFGSWKLGWWEFGAKIFVFQEVYETLLYLLTPFILPMSFYVRPSFCGILLGSTVAMYLINVIIFNEIHLRRKKERLGWTLLYVYYLPYKIVLTGINVASCYWSLWKYARYFARRHPKVVEDEKVLEVVLRLEEDTASKQGGLGRRMTVRTIASNPQTDACDQDTISPMQGMYRIVTEPEPAHMRKNSRALENDGIDATDYFFGRQSPMAKMESGLSPMAKMESGQSPMTKRESGQSPMTKRESGLSLMTKRESGQGEDRMKVRKKSSFGAWCRGYDRFDV